VTSETYWIINRRGERVFVVRNHAGQADRPLAVLAHGLSDVHDSAPMRALLDGFMLAGCDVLRWDATQSWGRSGGTIDRATLTAAYEDMTDVLAWADQQPWFRRPYVLAGHSLGGAAALRYAAAHTAAVHRLVLCAPVVSGRLLARRLHPVTRTLWWMAGRLPEPGHRGKYYRYQLLHDGLRYDGRKLAARLRVPTTIIAGAQDRLIPLARVEELAAAFPTPAELISIDQADHSFTHHLAELAQAARRAVTK
jgi:pimeloyl-ACP methyl ester carboxylesterase